MDERRTRKDEVIEEVFARLDKGDVRGESLMIGDREHDIFGAKKCGVESVGMRLGFAREGELEEAGADPYRQRFQGASRVAFNVIIVCGVVHFVQPLIIF